MIELVTILTAMQEHLQHPGLWVIDGRGNPCDEGKHLIHRIVSGNQLFTQGAVPIQRIERVAMRKHVFIVLIQNAVLRIIPTVGVEICRTINSDKYYVSKEYNRV